MTSGIILYAPFVQQGLSSLSVDSFREKKGHRKEKLMYHKTASFLSVILMFSGLLLIGIGVIIGESGTLLFQILFGVGILVILAGVFTRIAFMRCPLCGVWFKYMPKFCPNCGVTL